MTQFYDSEVEMGRVKKITQFYDREVEMGRVKKITQFYERKVEMERVKTRNVSMGHGCPRYCQIRIHRALSLTKGHNSKNS